jgi:hypothetical protein
VMVTRLVPGQTATVLQLPARSAEHGGPGKPAMRRRRRRSPETAELANEAVDLAGPVETTGTVHAATVLTGRCGGLDERAASANSPPKFRPMPARSGASRPQ